MYIYIYKYIYIYIYIHININVFNKCIWMCISVQNNLLQLSSNFA